MFNFGYPYRCEVKDGFTIDSIKERLIVLVEGHHTSFQTNNAVIGFCSEYKTIKYFPRGLEKVFPNIKSIYIWHAGLKQIEQADLEPLRSLVDFDVWGNEIKEIPKDLFKYNTELKHISFTDNRITFIDPNVFDNLNGLAGLFLDKTASYDWDPCVNFRIENDRDAVVEAIRELEGKCVKKSDEN